MMTKRQRTLSVLGGAALLVGVAIAAGAKTHAPTAAAAPAPAPTPTGAKIQIALLLDTSSSMDGLIDQARSQMWRIVHSLGQAKRDGRAAQVELALYEYGKSSLPAEDSWMRRIAPFTRDLDRVSEELFKLGTNGGLEYTGMVIQKATRELAWSDDPADLKLIFIAGNEEFTQGPVDYHESIAQAKAKGIVVNTIHCGPGEEVGWREAALIGGGQYLAIDHNRAVVAIDAPQDADLARLSQELNGTYVAYGAAGRAGLERQNAQDANAMRAQQGAVAQRALVKASANYDNELWDLVDGLKNGRVALDKLGEGELPDNMKKMSPDERRAYVEDMAGKRAELQQRIRELDAARQKYVAAERARRGAHADDTLDAVMVEAAQKAAAKAGYTVE
jgi:hypothetical protein